MRVWVEGGVFALSLDSEGQTRPLVHTKDDRIGKFSTETCLSTEFGVVVCLWLLKKNLYSKVSLR